MGRQASSGISAEPTTCARAGALTPAPLASRAATRSDCQRPRPGEPTKPPGPYGWTPGTVLALAYAVRSASRLALILLAMTLSATARAGWDGDVYYTPVAGKSRQEGTVRRDRFGNADGPAYDLGKDGAFRGQKIAVLQLYTGHPSVLGSLFGRSGLFVEDFDFKAPRAALAEKGFTLIHHRDTPPPPEVLEQQLEQASQLWLISDATRKLSDGHVDVIKRFFQNGGGLYLWGDNQPYYADTNIVSQALFGAAMMGNVPGDQVVPAQRSRGGPGFVPDHLLTTGLEHLYEGITIATIQGGDHALRPLLYGSAGNLVTAYYDQGGRRAILDGGFTRLYNKWDTAGSGRYVKNAAVWLANVERSRARAPEQPRSSVRWYQGTAPPKTAAPRTPSDADRPRDPAPHGRAPLGRRYNYRK